MTVPDAAGAGSPGRYHRRVVILHRTPPAHPSSRNGPGRRRLATLLLVIAIAVFGAGSVGVAGATGTQDPTLPTTSAAFGTEPAGVPVASTTVPAATAATPTTSGRSSEIDAENRRIALIVGGLVAVALALVLLTIRYWRTTRPVPLSDTVADAEPVAVPRSRAADRPGRRSRRAVAGADHAAADDTWEPRATGEQPRIDPPDTGRTVRPSRQQRAEALSRDGR